MPVTSEELRRRGYKALSDGVCREVYSKPGTGYVVKVCKSHETVGCSCENEATLWRNTKNDNLAPVLASGRCWVAMKRADLTADMECDYNHGDASDLWMEVEEVAVVLQNLVAELGVWDVHECNVGRFKDGWRVIDYGHVGGEEPQWESWEFSNAEY